METPLVLLRTYSDFELAFYANKHQFLPSLDDIVGAIHEISQSCENSQLLRNALFFYCALRISGEPLPDDGILAQSHGSPNVFIYTADITGCLEFRCMQYIVLLSQYGTDHNLKFIFQEKEFDELDDESSDIFELDDDLHIWNWNGTGMEEVD